MRVRCDALCRRRSYVKIVHSKRILNVRPPSVFNIYLYRRAEESNLYEFSSRHGDDRPYRSFTLSDRSTVLDKTTPLQSVVTAFSAAFSRVFYVFNFNVSFNFSKNTAVFNCWFFCVIYISSFRFYFGSPSTYNRNSAGVRLPTQHSRKSECGYDFYFVI